MASDTNLDGHVKGVEAEPVGDEAGVAIVTEAGKRLDQCMSTESDYRRDALSDQNFAIGNQWEDGIRTAREQAKQPCLQFNLIPKFLRQVTGDARQNVPAVNVVPANNNATKDVADILKGMVRYIEYQSTADYVYTKGLDGSTRCGRGAWRVDTEYEEGATFDQSIVIKQISNPLSVYWDTTAQGPVYRDAEWCIVRDWIDNNKFERLWPGKTPSKETLATGVGDVERWINDSAVCVAEYWRREPVEKELLHVQVFPKSIDGISPAPDPYDVVIYKDEMLEKFPDTDIQVVKRRKVVTYKIVCYTITGAVVLEKREWPGKWIPVIPVLGEETNVGGVEHLSGIVRDMKDPQRAYNYWMTMLTEQVALAPKIPWIVTDTMVESYLAEWSDMNSTNYPYIRYTPDPAQPSGPQRPLPPQISPGYAQMMQIAQGALNDTSGIFKPALGQESNETSGRAILARQKEGDTGTYVYIDNWLKSVSFTGEIIVDLIPHVYDSERVVQITDEQGETSLVQINQSFEENGIKKLYDVTTGKYGVRVTTGPSYLTKKQEAANSMLEFMRIYPAAAPVLGDLFAKSQDWEGSEEIADRLKALAIQQGLIPPEQPPVGPQAGPAGLPPQAQQTPQGVPVAGQAGQEQHIDQMLQTLEGAQ